MTIPGTSSNLPTKIFTIWNYVAIYAETSPTFYSLNTARSLLLRRSILFVFLLSFYHQQEQTKKGTSKHVTFFCCSACQKKQKDLILYEYVCVRFFAFMWLCGCMSECKKMHYGAITIINTNSESMNSNGPRDDISNKKQQQQTNKRIQRVCQL